MPTTKPSTEILTITPAIALDMLSHNVSNRNIRDRHVAALARDMRAGHWQMTGETIKFSDRGQLLDGQHRLLAVIESETEQEMMVVCGLTKDAQEKMDAGARRLASDALHLGGHSNPSVLAAAARLLLAYEGGHFSHATDTAPHGYTHSEIIECVKSHEPLIDEAATIGQTMWSPTKMKPAVGAFCFYELASIDHDHAVQFYDDLRNYRTTGEGDPRYSLLRRLSQAAEERNQMNSVEQAHYVFRAWNARRDGQRLSRLMTSIRGLPTEFAIPH